MTPLALCPSAALLDNDVNSHTPIHQSKTQLTRSKVPSWLQVGLQPIHPNITVQGPFNKTSY